MTLRKISFDNIVRYTPKSERMIENKTKTIPCKQNKKIHKTEKSFLIMFQHQDSNSLNE